MSQSASNSFLVLLSRPPHQRRDHDSPHQYCDHNDLGVEKVAVSQPASKCSSGKPEEKKSPEHYQVKGDEPTIITSIVIIMIIVIMMMVNMHW